MFPAQHRASSSPFSPDQDACEDAGSSPRQAPTRPSLLGRASLGVAIPAVMFFSWACADGPTEPSEASCTPETTSVEVSVTGGDPLVFDWEPACAMSILVVEPPDTAQDTGDRWAIFGVLENSGDSVPTGAISPPITYGVRPSSIAADNENEPLQLEVGREYELVLWRGLDPDVSVEGCLDSFSQLCMMALHTFRR